MGIADFLKGLFSGDQMNQEPKKAIRLVKTQERHVSKFGGRPNLPDGIPWPKNPEGDELDFLAQIHFPEVPPGLGLPATGTLFIFYDCEEQPWGSDRRDRKYWRVLYSEDTLSKVTRPRRNQRQDYDDSVQTFLLFQTFDSRPADGASYEKDGQGYHQMLGYPLFIQDEDMTPGRILLLQLDSDETGVGPMWMWSDYGRLFFWIRPEDLTNRRFDRVELVLECF